MEIDARVKTPLAPGKVVEIRSEECLVALEKGPDRVWRPMETLGWDQNTVWESYPGPTMSAFISSAINMASNSDVFGPILQCIEVELFGFGLNFLLSAERISKRFLPLVLPVSSCVQEQIPSPGHLKREHRMDLSRNCKGEIERKLGNT